MEFKHAPAELLHAKASTMSEVEVGMIMHIADLLELSYEMILHIYFNSTNTVAVWYNNLLDMSEGRTEKVKTIRIQHVASRGDEMAKYKNISI